jgi:hypothetical protein
MRQPIFKEVKMKSTIILLLLLIIVVFISTCSNDSTEPTLNPNNNSTKEFFPIDTGYSWTYQEKVFDVDGNPVELKNGQYSMNITYEVLGDTTIAGNKYYKLPHLISSTRTQYYSPQNNAVYGFTINEELGDYEPIHIYFKYPAQVGDKYETIDGEIAELISKDTTITVPAGTYKCYVYKFVQNKLYVAKFFISSGVGIVKVEHDSRMSSLIQTLMIWELKSYSKVRIEKKFFPLEKGYSWTYEYTANGELIGEGPIEVLSDTIINQNTYYKMYDIFGKTKKEYQYYSVLNDGIFGFTFNEETSITKPICLYFKYPAVIGDKYSTIDGTTAELISKDTRIEVPAGIFYCYAYKFIQTDLKEIIYYISPGTGIVKVDKEDEIMSMKVILKWELKSINF